MGGSPVSDDWEVVANGARTLLLIGRIGDGRSATGNSILGRKAFKSMSSFGGVTKTCEIQRTLLEDGQILDVIDTPGFEFTVESELVGNEIVKSVDLADDGIHAVLFVLSLQAHFSKEVQAAIRYFSQFFGKKIGGYMIVVFTGGDDLEDNCSLNDHLNHSCPENLKEALKMCGNRQVLFDNKTNDPMKKAEQLGELLFHVNMVVQKNGGKPYTNDLFEEVKKMKLHNDTVDVNSLLGDLKQEVTELKEQLQRWSLVDQHREITEMVESKLNDSMHRLEKQLEEERTARLEAEKNAESRIRELKDSLEKTQRKTEELTEKIIIVFQAKSGKAFLFDLVRNIVIGTKEERQLLTGLHTIAEIYCANCNEELGWKYERAVEPSQKYKEGKFILEESKIVKDNW
ncbi:Protein yippee-like [Capsicum annuum]|nr:Protein yippee-like [Capsicum annuum]